MTEQGGPPTEPLKPTDPRITEPRGGKRSLLDYPQTEVADVLVREANTHYDDSDQSGYNPNPLIFGYFRSVSVASHPNIAIGSRESRVVPLFLADELTRIGNKQDPTIRIISDIWKKTDSSDTSIDDVLGNAKTYVVLPAMLPENLSPDALLDANKLRKYHPHDDIQSRRKKYIMRSLDAIRKGPIPASVQKTDPQFTEVESLRDMLKGVKKAPAILAEYMRKGLTAERYREELNRAEQWLLDKLEENKHEETSTTPEIGEIPKSKLEVFPPEPTSRIVGTGEKRKPKRVEFNDEKMEKYRDVVQNWVDGGGTFEETEADFGESEIHGITTGERPTTVSSGEPQEQDPGKNIWHVAILGFETESGYKGEHVVMENERYKNSCYIVRDDVVQFWRQVTGNKDFSWRDIVKYSRTAARSMGARAVDHDANGMWKSKIDDYLARDSELNLNEYIAGAFNPESGLFDKHGIPTDRNQIPNELLGDLGRWYMEQEKTDPELSTKLIYGTKAKDILRATGSEKDFNE